MLTIIFSWSVFFCIFSLIGKLLLQPRLLKFLKINETPAWYEYYWIGFTSVLAILQIWSFFLPVNATALMFIGLIAFVSLIVLIRTKIKIPKVNINFVLLTGFILITISYFASLSGGWGDTLGYHITAVKWANLSKVVPGLANLYTRLGFNSSTFLYDALVSSFFLKDRATHVAVSLLTAVLSIEFLWILLKSKDLKLKIFCLLTIPIFIEGIVHSVQVASFSYDFILLMLVLVICVEIIQWSRKTIYISIILSILLITVKLSGLAFSIVIVLFTLYKLLWRKQRDIRTLSFTGLAFAILIMPYTLRNIVLSGWPFYPLPAFNLRMPWTVPIERVSIEYEVIKAWAILPGKDWRMVVGQNIFQWFPGWLDRNSGHMELKIFVLSIILLFLLLVRRHINKNLIKKNMGVFVCIVASAASIIYLLLSAPDFRFGAIYFWVLFASVASYFFVFVWKKKKIILSLSFLLSLYFIYKISWPPRIDSEIMLRSLRWDQPGGTYEVLVTPIDGSPAFKVNMAKEDSFCGNAELPCTSEVSNYFKEKVPGNIFGGYEPVD